MPPIQIQKGTSRDLVFQARTARGPSIDVFDLTWALTAAIWPGDELPAILTPPASWETDGTDAKFVVGLLDADSADVEAGEYLLQVWAAKGGRRTPLLDLPGQPLEFTDAPGSGSAPAVYCTLQDMLDEGGDWLVTRAQARSRTNFATERGKARAWLDAVIMGKVRTTWDRCATWDLLTYGPSANSFYWGGPEEPDKVLSDALAADGLQVDERLRQAVACYAIYLVCSKSITDEADDPWPMRAARFKARARSLVVSSTAAVDLNADGVADVWINLGFSSMR